MPAFHFTRCKLLHWSGVDYCDVSISCFDSHSDGTHSLQRIHWWASDAMLNFSRSVLMKKQTHLYLANFQQFILNNNREISVENPWFQICICYIHIFTVKTTRIAHIKTITAVFLTGCQRTRVWTCSRIPHKTCSEIQPWKQTQST